MFPWDDPGRAAMQHSRTRTLPTHSRYSIDQRMHARRDAERRVDDIRATVQKQSISQLQATSDERVSNLRTKNATLRMAGEAMMEQRLAQEAEEARRRQRDLQQQQALAQELDRRQREEERRRREIQRICEADEGLRDLQEKLKAAYMNKERAVQLQERHILRERTEEEQRLHDEAIERERRLALIEQYRADARRRDELEAAKVVLEQQMHEKERRMREEAAREFEREKSQVDEVVRRVLAEDRKEMEARARKRADTRRYVAEYMSQRLELLERRRREEREEEERIQRYAEQRAQREAAEEKRKAEADAAASRIYQKLKSEYESKRRDEEELLSLRETLMEAENEQRRWEEEQRKLERERRSREEMMAANERQQQLRREREAREREEEERLIQVMLEKFEADARREREEAAARRRAREEFMRGVSMQVAERDALYEAERRREEEERRAAEEEDAFRRKVVEEARRRLLEEHAAKLAGYLPKGVLQSEADLEVVRAFAGAEEEANLAARRLAATGALSAQPTLLGVPSAAARGAAQPSSRGSSQRSTRPW